VPRGGGAGRRSRHRHGVGHFPTKAALLDTVLAARFRRLRDAAQQAPDDRSPGQALDDFFGLLVRDARTKIAIADAITEAGAPVDSEAERAARELVSAIDRLIAEAQSSREIRLDIGGQEVYAIVAGTARALAQMHLSGEAARRAIAAVLCGLRPPHARRA
jgi:AcrR family transcriptional regulator